jgi:hypothetical protein
MSLRHAHSVVDRSVCSCASVSRGKHVSNFPIGAMGKFEVLRGTYLLYLTKGSAAVVQARVEASTSARFPSGRWEILGSLRHVHAVVIEATAALCKRESRQACQQLSHRGSLGNLQVKEVAAATYRSNPPESPGDVEPDQLHDAERARDDVQHTVPTLCIQHDRACHRRLEDDAPGDAELGVEYVRAGVKDNVAGSGAGKCTGQAIAGAHCGLQRTAVAREHMLNGV